LENPPHATIYLGPNPIFNIRSQLQFNLAFCVDENLVIVFKRTGVDPNETSAHSLVKGTGTANLPPRAETFVVVYGHDSSEGARKCYFHTG